MLRKREGRSFAEPAPTPEPDPTPARRRKRWVRPDVPRPEAPTRLDVLSKLPSAGRRDLMSAALAGAAMVAVGLGAAVGRATVGDGEVIARAALSPADARLIALADAYETLDRRCNEHTAAHSGRCTPETDAEFDLMVDGFGPLEQECAAIPADSLAGVVAKARLCRSPTARGCADHEHIASVADDVWRLFGGSARA